MSATFAPPPLTMSRSRASVAADAGCRSSFIVFVNLYARVLVSEAPDGDFKYLIFPATERRVCDAPLNGSGFTAAVGTVVVTLCVPTECRTSAVLH